MSAKKPPATTPPEPTGTGKAVDLYRVLLAAAKHPAKRENLGNVWTALEALRQKGAKAYPRADVHRWLKNRGWSPKEPTIENLPQGRDYQALITVYEEQYGARAARSLGDDEEDVTLPLAIQDPALAARVRAMLALNRGLRHRNDILHKHHQELQAQLAQQPHLAQQALPAPAHAALLGAGDDGAERQAAAVRAFLGRIDGFGWTAHEPSGALLDQRRNELAPPGFLQALRRLAG